MKATTFDKLSLIALVAGFAIFMFNDGFAQKKQPITKLKCKKAGKNLLRCENSEAICYKYSEFEKNQFGGYANGAGGLSCKWKG